MLSDVQKTTGMRGLRAALDIADFIQRDGHRSYLAVNIQEPGTYSASLCGMTGIFLNTGRVVAMKTYDLDITITTDMANMALVFKKGDEAILLAWHRNLCAYQKSMSSVGAQNRMITPAALAKTAA